MAGTKRPREELDLNQFEGLINPPKRTPQRVVDIGTLHEQFIAQGRLIAELVDGQRELRAKVDQLIKTSVTPPVVVPQPLITTRPPIGLWKNLQDDSRRDTKQ